MQYIDVGRPGSEVRGGVSVYAGGAGVREVHLVLAPARPGPAAVQARRLEEAYAAVLAEHSLPPASVVFRRIFASDLVNQGPAVAASGLSQGAPVSRVQQTPLAEARLALYAYHVDDPAQPAPASRQVDGTWVWERQGRRQVTVTHLSRPGSDGAYEQTQGLLADLEAHLARQGMTVNEHALRTWIYLQAIDLDYAGMVQARREFLTARGLTAATHYIASTGIAGGAGEPTVRVMMDAVALAGLRPGQIQYLQARDHLSPTHLYGVTFERGTAITFGDRRHVLLSGTASIDAQGQIVHPGAVLRQLERILENLAALLAEAGAGLTDLTHVLIYLRDSADRTAVARAFRRRLPGVPYLVLEAPVCRPGWLIEVEGTAIVPVSRPEFAPF